MSCRQERASAKTSRKHVRSPRCNTMRCLTAAETAGSDASRDPDSALPEGDALLPGGVEGCTPDSRSNESKQARTPNSTNMGASLSPEEIYPFGIRIGLGQTPKNSQITTL